MSWPPELLGIAPAVVAGIAMLLTAAVLSAARPRATVLLERRGGSGPEHREREGACICLPDTGFHPFYDPLR